MVMQLRPWQEATCLNVVDANTATGVKLSSWLNTLCGDWMKFNDGSFLTKMGILTILCKHKEKISWRGNNIFMVVIYRIALSCVKQ